MAAPVRLVCLACQFESPGGMRFCGLCGSPLGGSSPDGSSLGGNSLANAAPRQARRVPRARLGERRLLTVMFCDMVGSTRLASLMEQEDLRQVVLTFRQVCGGAVEHWGGLVGQYLGDGILAYFGYPRTHEEDAHHALRAALEARAALPLANAELARQGLRLPHPLTIRIGVHSGLVVVEDLGRGRQAETAAILGETPNLAARLQAAAEPGGILVSEATAQLAGNRFLFTDAGRRELAGVPQPMQTFQLGAELPQRLPRAVATPFVGRDTEMAELLLRWQDASGGSGSAIVVEAEAGLGKTRFLCEFQRRLGAPARRTVQMACSPEGRSSPYHPVLSWIRSALGVTEASDPATVRQALRRQRGPSPQGRDRAYLATLLDCATADEQLMLADPPRRRRRETIDALLAFLFARLHGPGPHLVLIEDMHWADESTVAFARALAARCAAGCRVLCVMTTRPASPSKPDFATAVLTLHPLAEAASRLLVKALAPGPMAEHLVNQIVQRTDGIPLFTEELTRLVYNESGGEFGQAGNVIPLTLRGTLAAKLDGLGPAKSLAQLAAVIGRSFELEVLEAVVDEGQRYRTSAALSRLVHARFLEPQGPAEAPSGYVFRHALLRDAAYDSLPRDRRQALHRQVGTAVRDRFPGVAQSRPELVAQHFALAAMPLEAAEQFEAAARRAASRSGNAEAAEHCRSALAQLGRLPATDAHEAREVRLQIVLAAQVTAVRGNADPAVRAAFERARAIAEKPGHERWLRRALRGLHTFHLVQGDVTAGYAISRRVVELAGDGLDAGQRIQLHRPHGLTLLYLGEFAEARRELLAAISLYDAALHAEHRFEYGSDPLVLSRCHLGWVEWFLGDVAAAARECAEAVATAAALEHPHSLAFALAFKCCLSEFTEDVAGARRGADELVTLAEQHEYAYWAAWGRVVGGAARAVGGEREEGEALLRRGLQEYEATGAGLLVPYAAMLLARIVAPAERARLLAAAGQKARRGGMGIWFALAERRAHWGPLAAGRGRIKRAG